MRYCNRHFENLKLALKKKNLWRLVDTDVVVLKHRAHLWLHGQSAPGDYCPLVVSMIETHHKIRVMLMGTNVEILESACPLCLASHYLGEKVDDLWIDNCTDAIYIQAFTNGLVKSG